MHDETKGVHAGIAGASDGERARLAEIAERDSRDGQWEKMEIVIENLLEAFSITKSVNRDLWKDIQTLLELLSRVSLKIIAKFYVLAIM